MNTGGAIGLECVCIFSRRRDREKRESAEPLSSPDGNPDKPGAQKKQVRSFGNRYWRIMIYKESVGYSIKKEDYEEDGEHCPDESFHNFLIPTFFPLVPNNLSYTQKPGRMEIYIHDP